MKIIFLITLLFLISCSGGGGSSEKSASKGLSAAQTQAKNLIAQDVKSLQENQYNITDSDLKTLQSEGLISQEELNSLNVVK